MAKKPIKREVSGIPNTNLNVKSDTKSMKSCTFQQFIRYICNSNKNT